MIQELTTTKSSAKSSTKSSTKTTAKSSTTVISPLLREAINLAIEEADPLPASQLQEAHSGLTTSLIQVAVDVLEQVFYFVVVFVLENVLIF